MYALDEVLHPLVVTDMYSTHAGRFFENPLLETYGGDARRYRGDRFQFAYHAAARTPAPANLRGQPARVLQATGATQRQVYMVRSFNEIGLSADALQMVRRPEDLSLQEAGREEIRRQMEDFGDRHRLFRAVCLAKTLTAGEIHFDNAGHVVEGVAEAAYTVDLGVPAAHKGDLTHGGVPLIDRAWSESDAAILDQLDAIKVAAQEDGAPEPRHLWLHHSAKRHLRANAQLQSYLQGSAERIDAVLRGSVIDELAGWTWHFYSGAYRTADGASRPFIPEGRAVMTPDPGPWLRAADGSELLPTYVGPRATVDEALADVEEVFGDFAYVLLDDNPTRLVLRMGANFAYALAEPKAVWMPTIDF